MKNGSFILLIDAGYGGSRKAANPGIDAEGIPLMPNSGEYCVVIRRLTALGSGGPAGHVVPDEIFLHLYCYELLERICDQAQCREGVTGKLLIMPFWPECLVGAAGLPAHGVREILTMIPAAERTYYLRRTETVLEAEARRVLGAVRFDPGSYNEALDAAAERKGWILTEETD